MYLILSLVTKIITTFYLNFYPCAASTLTTDFTGLRLWDFLLKNHIVKLSSDGIMKSPSVSRTKKTTRERRDEIALRRRSRKKKKKNRGRQDGRSIRGSVPCALFYLGIIGRTAQKTKGRASSWRPCLRGVGGWLAVATAQHQRRSRESYYARPAK